MSQDLPPIGLVLGSHMPAEGIPRTAKLTEELGFGELWFSEDCFFTGAMSGVTAALSVTERLPIGIGIVSAVTRHPALLAMELATMSRLYPGRVLPGVGLGVPAWLDQMGIRPRSPLSAMRECVTNVRALLDGREVTSEGRVFTFDSVQLTHLPQERLPIYTGIVNENGLRLSGEIADGTVLSVLAGTDYVRWARERIDEGRSAAGRQEEPHRAVTYTLFSVDHDRSKAREAVRDSIAFYLEAMPKNALSQVLGITEQVGEILARGGAAAVAREMPDDWIDLMAVAGDPDECAAKLDALLEAGSDSVGLWLFPTDRGDEVAELCAREVLPRLRAPSIPTR
jgi:alkanesulfonate monooxygenase SsuD/methylene tetrahydromethanopterin reductase-like flavin-dependent oxidoreductase (luciferase family)